MDFIFIRELRLEAWIGLHRYEKIEPQTIEPDLEIGVPGDSVFESGKVGDTVDYGVVVQNIRTLLAGERFGLVENLADRIARMILAEFHAPRVKVCVTKLGVLKEAARVGVCIERNRGAA